MTFWISHSTLLRETIVNGYFVNIEPLRIGTGQESPLGSTVDLAVIRIDYRGTVIPYIPGSSLKGVFRSYATCIARTKGLKACSGFAKETCMDTVTVSTELGQLTLSRYVDLKLKEGDVQGAMKAFWEHACLICKVFGSPSYRGKVSFSDAFPIDEADNILPFTLGTRTGIAIDRRTGAVQRGALYTVEYVSPGAKFRFSMRCTNLPNYALGLLASVLKMIDAGQVKLGGFKTRGFGAVRFEDLRFATRDIPQEGSVMRALESGIDEPVNLSGVAELRDGWLLAKGSSVWAALRRLEEVWERVAGKS